MSGQNCQALRDTAAVVLACLGCRIAWEPHPDDWATGNTGCPTCGAATVIGDIVQSQRGSS